MDIFQFAEIDKFLIYFKPLSQYGKTNFNKRKLYFDLNKLNDIYNLIDILKDFCSSNPQLVTHIENYLKKIQIIDIGNEYNFSDIFLIKKLLINYTKILDKLPDDIKDIFQLKFNSHELLDLLLKDNSQNETFYISVAFSDELANIRNQIAEIDIQIAQHKNKVIEDINQNYNLNFIYQDFVVIPTSKVKDLTTTQFHFEPYDNEHLIAKINYPKEFFDLLQTRENLTEKEQNIVNQIIREISDKIKSENDNLIHYIKAITNFDILLAKAKLALEFNLIRPTLLKNNSKISIKNGYFIPLKERCKKNNTVYTHLTVEFNHKVNIINGSNMGGKTILLKTILFLQILAQLGFFVPCDIFETVLFEHLGYIGETENQNYEGLSSFGIEITSFNENEKHFNKINLLIIDEFARTTNSIEAKAILNSIIEYITNNPNCYAFISTHFMDLHRFENVGYYRMKGLNYEEYQKSYISENLTLNERIKLLNAFMQYEVLKNDDQKPILDALKISSILGINKKILELTNKYIERGDE